MWTHDRRQLVALACCLAAASCWGVCRSASATDTQELHCDVSYEADAVYPTLPTGGGPDLGGEAGIILYLEQSRVVVEIGACLYAVDGVLQLELGELDYMTAWIELPASAEASTLFVTRNGEHTDRIEAWMTHVSLTLSPDTTYALELAGPGQPRPIKPLIVLEPTSENPAP